MFKVTYSQVKNQNLNYQQKLEVSLIDELTKYEYDNYLHCYFKEFKSLIIFFKVLSQNTEFNGTGKVINKNL